MFEPGPIGGGFDLPGANAPAATQPRPPPPPPDNSLLRMPAYITYMDAMIQIGPDRKSIFHYLSRDGTKKPKSGPAATFLADRDQCSVQAVIDAWVPPDARYNAFYQGLGAVTIQKTHARAPGTAGHGSRKSAEEIATELDEMYLGVARGAEAMRTTPAAVAVGTEAGTGTAAPAADKWPYPLTHAQVRSLLADANRDGHAKGVVPLLHCLALPSEWIRPLALMCSVAVEKAACVMPLEIPVALAPAAPAPTGFPLLVVDTCMLTNIFHQCFSIYDKGDTPITHGLSPAQEALWWVLFVSSSSVDWAANWNVLLDHEGLDANRYEADAATGHAPPRTRGTKVWGGYDRCAVLGLGVCSCRQCVTHFVNSSQRQLIDEFAARRRSTTCASTARSSRRRPPPSSP